MNKNLGNIIMVIIVMIITVPVQSCSENKEYVYKQELFQFDNAFIPRYAFEDNDYVYIASMSEDENITRINKKTDDIENLNIGGFGLTVYKNYLYYMNKHEQNNLCDLYRVDLNKLDEEPQLVHNEIEPISNNSYYIANDMIYLYPAYFPTYYININDFSQKTEYYNRTGKYFIAGIDEKYRYIITLTLENDKHIYTLARCLHKDTEFENQEYLFAINQPEWADLRFNDFLVINNGFIYYCFNFAIYKCELKPDAESEIIYEVDEFGNDRFEVIAVTDDGIYIAKSHFTNEPVHEYVYNKDYLYKIDFNGNNEVALEYPQLPYFVSIEDGKLKYIKDNKVCSLE